MGECVLVLPRACRSEEEVQLHVCPVLFWTSVDQGHELFWGVTDDFNGRPPTEVHLLRDGSALRTSTGLRHVSAELTLCVWPTSCS